MILFLPVYMRAILKAASLASVPEVVKKYLMSPLGKTSVKQFAPVQRALAWHSPVR